MNLSLVSCLFLTFVNDSSQCNLPTGTARNSGQEGKNYNRNQELEHDNHLPVPFTQLGNILCAGEVDPEADEGTNRIEHLPKGHDLSTDLSRCKLADIDRARCYEKRN